ncbi:AbrB/MazE/SpoVT family DNA-binding domain-containing protein [Candidatus Woesearchaeota archaeon]|nr:AbrB/MazE/SpoVT family DNA-binding domain-containing protein [Candidatus Woesearchaeota archaeon]
MGEMTVVTRGSQITLTKGIREAAGIREGDRVILNVVGNTVVVAKRDPSVFDNLKRFLPDNFEEILKKTRTDDRKRLKRLGII